MPKEPPNCPNAVGQRVNLRGRSNLGEGTVSAYHEKRKWVSVVWGKDAPGKARMHHAFELELTDAS